MPLFDCDADGKITERRRGHNISLAEPREFTPLAESNYDESYDAEAQNNTKKRSKKGRPKKSKSASFPKLIESTLLPDAERDELHIEIWKYFKWLHDELSSFETSDHPGVKHAPYTSEGIQRVMGEMESVFRAIRDSKTNDAEEERPQKGYPLLEDVLEETLTRRVMELGRKRRAKPKIRNKEHDFDEMFEKLVKYKEEHGSCCVPAKWKEDVPVSLPRNLIL